MSRPVFRTKLTLRRYSIIIISILTALILFYIGLNVSGAVQLDIRVRQSMQQVLTYYGAETDTRLKQVENYVFGELVTDEDFGYLMRGGDQRRPEHLDKIREKLSSLYKYYSDMDGFFIYEEESALLMMHIYTGNNNRLLLNNAARSQILRAALEDNCTSEKAGKWQVTDVDGIACAVYAAYYRGYYMGTILTLDSVLANFGADGSFADGEFYLADAEGNALTGNRSNSAILTDTSGMEDSGVAISSGDVFSGSRLVVEDRGVKMMRITQDMGRLPVQLVALVPLRGISGLWLSFLPIFVMMLVITAAVLTGVIWEYYVIIMRPLRALDESIRRFSEGNLTARAEESSLCAEIDQVSRNFNQMTEQITALKIEGYEKELANRDIELRYRQIQMNPHFFLNILNVIHTLAISGNTMRIREVTLDLMKYTRYILSVRDRLVPLKEEMDFVEHYVRIQRLRVTYGTNISIKGLDEGATAELSVPPLTVQTFIENAFKYAIRDGESLRVCIQFSVDPEGFLVIRITDDGNGFPPAMLEAVNREGQIPADDRGEHIGISNVLARLRIIYGDRYSYSFSNRPEGGGEVVLRIPAEVYSK